MAGQTTPVRPAEPKEVQRTLLTSTRVKVPRELHKVEVDLVRRLFDGPLGGRAGEAPIALVTLFDRGWINVTDTGNGTWHAELSVGAARAAPIMTPVRILLVPEQPPSDWLANMRPDVADAWRVAYLCDTFEYTSVTSLRIHDQPGPYGPWDIRLIIDRGDLLLSEADGLIPCEPLDEDDGDSAEFFDEARLRAIREQVGMLVHRHGPSVVVDLIQRLVNSPLAHAAQANAPWMERIPTVLADAIVGISPTVRLASDEELIAWVDAGLPPIRLRCWYFNGTTAYDGDMHQVQVVGDTILTPFHDDREADELRAIVHYMRNACYALETVLRSTGPFDELPVFMHSGPMGEKPRHMPLGQAQRADWTRTVWLAARWLRAGRSLADVEPLLNEGPGPED